MNHLITRGGTTLTFRPITEDRYNEALECLPPIAWVKHGFLIGEAWDFVALDAETGANGYVGCLKFNGEHYETTAPITASEWRHLNDGDCDDMIEAYSPDAPAYRSPWYATAAR